LLEASAAVEKREGGQRRDQREARQRTDLQLSAVGAGGVLERSRASGLVVAHGGDRAAHIVHRRLDRVRPDDSRCALGVAGAPDVDRATKLCQQLGVQRLDPRQLRARRRIALSQTLDAPILFRHRSRRRVIGLEFMFVAHPSMILRPMILRPLTLRS